MSVDSQFELMLKRFDSSAAGGLNAIFQYQIEDGEAYHICIDEGGCSIKTGEHDSPTVTLTLNEDTLAEIMTGETDGMQAFMSGQLTVTGDLMLATRLPELFPIA